MAQFAHNAPSQDALHASRRLPFATIVVLLLVGVVTSLQFVYPVVLETLRRNPMRFAAGQWWRLLSPLLVHADGSLAWVFNSVGIALVGPLVERIFGSWRWLLLFLVGGLAGNISGYAWEPYGAGSSVGMFGLIGGLFAWLLIRNERVWPITLVYAIYIIVALIGQTIGGNGITDVVSIIAAVLVSVSLNLHRAERMVLRVIAIAGLLGAVALTLLSNNHGPPIIAGACVGALLCHWRPTSGTE